MNQALLSSKKMGLFPSMVAICNGGKQNGLRT